MTTAEIIWMWALTAIVLVILIDYCGNKTLEKIYSRIEDLETYTHRAVAKSHGLAEASPSHADDGYVIDKGFAVHGVHVIHKTGFKESLFEDSPHLRRCFVSKEDPKKILWGDDVIGFYVKAKKK